MVDARPLLRRTHGRVPELFCGREQRPPEPRVGEGSEGGKEASISEVSVYIPLPRPRHRSYLTEVYIVI